MQYIFNIYTKPPLKFISLVYTGIMTEIFKTCVPVCLEHMSNCSSKALADPIPKRHLYWIKNSLRLRIFCFVLVVFCLFFPSKSLLGKNLHWIQSSPHGSGNKIKCITSISIHSYSNVYEYGMYMPNWCLPMWLFIIIFCIASL